MHHMDVVEVVIDLECPQQIDLNLLVAGDTDKSHVLGKAVRQIGNGLGGEQLP